MQSLSRGDEMAAGKTTEIANLLQWLDYRGPSNVLVFGPMERALREKRKLTTSSCDILDAASSRLGSSNERRTSAVFAPAS
jgi:hypothetical protein